MTISTFERNATIAEMAVEIDRRGAVIERLEAALAERDRRIAAALDELQAVAAGQSEISKVFALLSPATDKGGK